MTQAAALTRIYNVLRTGAAHTAYELADECFCVRRHAQWCVTCLRDHGLAHISHWRRQTGEGARGRPHTAVWAYGPGPDAERPQRLTSKQARTLRIRRLKAKYGQLATAILRPRKSGGASVLMLGGEVVYRRGVPRGRKGAAE